MNTGISRLWREPLLHFLLIGLALFVLYEQTREAYSESPKRIHVTRGQVEQLAANFERSRTRPPTAEELDALIEGYVREEVFYREALAMGLDRDDPLVRRRMRMKLEFMLEDLATQDAADTELNEFLRRRSEEFHTEAQLSFRQVYLNPERREDLARDAQRLLTRLKGGAPPESLGDHTLLPRTYSLARQSEIARDIGVEFAAELPELPLGQWAGPIYSSFGAHLVHIERRIDARLPPLSEIRERVLSAYQADQRKQQKDVAYQKLREEYEISIESTPEGARVDRGVAFDVRAARSR
jgi:hypothetical protein